MDKLLNVERANEILMEKSSLTCTLKETQTSLGQESEVY
jgi:hypothetical protein